MERDAFNAGRLGPSPCEDGIAKLGGPTSELYFSTTSVMAESVLTVTAGDGSSTAERGRRYSLSQLPRPQHLSRCEKQGVGGAES